MAIKKMEQNQQHTKSQPYRHDRDLNWYFDAKNIPNQNAVFDTRDFVEKHRSPEIDLTEFFNLLFKQKDEIANYLDRPFDFIAHLRGLPIKEIERYTLLGMLLYWHSGNPDNLLETDENSTNYKSILRLIREEFDKEFPNTYMPEKGFCTNEAAQRRLRDVAANLNAEMKSQDNRVYPSSDYVSALRIDFDGLPHYVIEKGIIRRWEEERFRRDTDYESWQFELQSFLSTIPEDKRLLSLQKGIEYGKKCWDYHVAMDCETPDDCALSESWERRLSIAERMLQDYLPQPNQTELIGDTLATKNPEFTTARQVLAIHYLLEYAQTPMGDKTHVARFIEFLTGKNYKNIYDAVRSPMATKGKGQLRIKDLQYVRSHFENLGLIEIVKMINNELNTPDY